MRRKERHGREKTEEKKEQEKKRKEQGKRLPVRFCGHDRFVRVNRVCPSMGTAEFGSFLQGILEDGIRETVNTAARQETVFPELTVTVEEVAGDFYYQQLSGKNVSYFGRRNRL